jgi:lysophospholipase L1-like esterase
LFQGDSITEGYRRNRKRHYTNIDDSLGDSFVYQLAAYYGTNYPSYKFRFMNDGVSGNLLSQMYDRLSGSIAARPDIINILIGINDVQYWSLFPMNVHNYTGFEELYDRLIKRVKKELSQTLLVICGPFASPGDYTATTIQGSSRVWNDTFWQLFNATLHELQGIVRRLTIRCKLIYVDFQKPFTEMTRLHPPADYWLVDGIHPSVAGSYLLRYEWIRQVEEQLGKVRVK